MGAVKEHFSDVRISANEAETNRAKESASLANERAAEANLKAEFESVERLKLEAKLAPRLFSPEQRAKLISTLIQFKGMSADIVVYPTGTSDIGPLQQALTTTLIASGWSIRTWNMLNGEIVIGVGVATKSSGNASAELAANSLISALNTAGILTARSGPFAGNDFPMPAVGPAPVGETAPIRIYVGTKPP